MNRREATGMAQEAAARLEGYTRVNGPIKVNQGLIHDMREIMGMVQAVADWIDDNQEKAEEAVGLLRMVSRHAKEIATQTDHKLLHSTLEAIRRIATDATGGDVQPQRDQAEQSSKRTRNINHEALEALFTVPFRGRNAVKVDYYNEYLRGVIEAEHTAKDWCKLCLMMYGSPNVISMAKKNTFTAFARQVSAMADIPYNANYKPSKAPITEEDRLKYFYLVDKIGKA